MNNDKQHLAHLRRLVETPEYINQLKEIYKQFENFKFVHQAINRDLQDYAHLEDEYLGVYWKETAAVGKTPSFTICYTFDDSIVKLFSIELT